MALIVKIFVNQTEIIDTHVVRIKGKPGELCTYRTGSGHKFQHHYNDGAAKLAITMREIYDKENPFVLPT